MGFQKTNTEQLHFNELALNINALFNLSLPCSSVLMINLSDMNQPITCQHALVNDAGSTDEHSVTRHDGPIARNDYDITWHQVRGQSFLCF